MKNKVILFAFASNDLKKSAKRLLSQANDSKFYDEINIISPNKFDNILKSKIKHLFSKGKKRGFGYWIWKPYLLKKIFDKINYGDIVNYLDIGCHLIKKNSLKFNQYLKFIKQDENWILPFQYHSNLDHSVKNISFPNRDERKYTKGDLLEYFNFYNDTKKTDTPQFWAGCFFIKKTDLSIKFLDEWLSVFDKNFQLIDDTPSIKKNLNGFQENRHDQSVYSLLCKKYDLKSFSAYECEWAYLNNDRTWQHNKDFPILAKRDLKYSIMTRFLRRQKKNLRRLFKLR